MLKGNLMRRVGLLMLAMAAAAPAFAADVTFLSLLKEMTDLEGLSRMPDPPYTCKQFSSYDQKSTDPAVRTDENWFANGDRGQYLRKETRDGKDEFVLMDAEGPGAIVRFWSANPNDAGRVKIYLDGAEAPAVDMLLMSMLGGKKQPFPNPIAGMRARGWNSYLPIPYAKQCKVVTTKSDFYYHINYRTYPPGTEVETFSEELAKEHRDTIDAVAVRLAEPQDAAELPGAGQKGVSIQTELAPASPTELASIEGPAAIHVIACRMEAEELDAALRGCLLEIAFDGQEPPAVSTPLGDFFGTAPGAHPFASLPCGLLEEQQRFYSHWVMPFREKATVRVTNHTGQAVVIRGDIVAAQRPWTDDSLYFHAKWRSERGINTRPRHDWNFVKVAGKGRYAGNMLHIANPVKAWWGEGDEKIYVDNEAFPSHFGTGSEDYYGYAWCTPKVFTHAYHNQPRVDGPGNFGHTCVNRFHIIDNIPFATAFQFDIEVWHWAECVIDQSAVSYWYAAPGSTDNFPAIEPADLVVPVIPQLAIHRVGGALEGEKMRIIEATGGETQTQASDQWKWSGGGQLWWIDAKPGDTLRLGFAVEKSGRYTVRAVFTKARDYGIAQLSINGTAAGGERDFYNPAVTPTPECDLGAFDLKKGENELQVEIIGANAKADPRHMFGLDYLRLRAAD